MKYLILILLLLTACSREEDVAKYAHKEKWDSYTVHGYCWFGCSDKDFYQTKFTAIKDGQVFKGCTCSGFLFKNTTLRLD